MRNTQWTKKQLDVINTRGRNILVSAAAGSGKTAVLVERIIRMITDENCPIDIDRLLVVTFTRAAAAEMKERIREALEQMAEENPLDQNIVRQLSLIHNANISTIDSFCAMVVRENFDKIDLDPNFRIADDTEIEMLKTDCLEEMLEEYYNNADEQFMILAEQYSTGKAADNISELILELYTKASGSIDPVKWLEKCVWHYNIESEEQLENSFFIHKLMEIAKKQIEDCLWEMDRAMMISEEPDGPHYRDKLVPFIDSIRRIGACEKYEDIKKSFDYVEKITLTNVKECNQDKKKQVQNIKKDVSERIKKLKSELFTQSTEQILSDIEKCRPSVEMIVKLAMDFYQRFQKVKEEKSVMDFNDQAHFALQILNNTDEDGNLFPSEVAVQMAKNYKEIMIDEYQDSNYVQEAILSSVSKGFGVNNMFMVGDVKQSIYRFRQAEPKLFLEKFDTYSEDLKQDQCKIILDKNFRSREEVIDGVNCIFDFIMNKNVGGICYRDKNRLSVGAAFFDVPKTQDDSTEVVLIEGSEKKEEAQYVAKKILEITDPVNGMKIADKNGGLRPVKYSDITILLRSIKGVSEIYLEQLENNNIPAYSDSRTGYYKTIEIMTMMNMLTIIDNPVQDIPLVAVLVSPMFHFSDNELAVIKAENICDNFYDSLMMYSLNGSDMKIIEKINYFIFLLNKYRDTVPYTSVYELINEILKDTGYGFYITAMPNGRRRFLNIQALKEKAVAYDSISYKGLFNFIRYVEKLQYLDTDDGEASVTGENDNTVKIMTIHKSKGLQFPVVFLCNTGGKMKPDNDKISIDDNGYMGVDYIDEKLHIKAPTLIKNIIKKQNKEEDMAERLRILYVALTRAQEKLFVTGLCKDIHKTVEKYQMTADDGRDIMSYSDILGANNLMDWIGQAMFRENSPIKVHTVSNEQIVFTQVSDSISEEIKEIRLSKLKAQEADLKTKRHIKKIKSFVYPYLEDITMKSKASVTEIKRDRLNSGPDEEAEEFFSSNQEQLPEIIPDFALDSQGKEKKLTGADRGSAYHRCFELLDMECANYSLERMEIMLNSFVENGMMKEIEIESVNKEDILNFTKSSLFDRMKTAYDNGTLYRERKFLMGLPAKKFNENEIYISEKDKEIMIVQGIIDVCFEENGRYVIADYKTDNVQSMEELVKRYKVQLECYKIALEKISGIEVSDMIIYSVKLGKEIKVL